MALADTFLRWIGARPLELADTATWKSYAQRESDALKRGDSKALGRVRRHRRADLHHALWRVG